MRLNRSGLPLLSVLLVSLVVNAVTGVLLRREYVRYKRLAAEPTYEHFYVSENKAVREHASGSLLVLVGDSRIQQWGAARFPGYETLNRGVGGETTAQMLHHFQADVLDLQPGVVVIEAGINDLVAAGLSQDGAAAMARRTVEN